MIRSLSLVVLAVLATSAGCKAKEGPQVAFLLSSPNEDFTGGEFVLTEQRPRMQSRVEVVPLQKGDAVVFAVNQRPVQGTRGVYRVAMRHGVSRIRSGQRYTMGIIFHDAATADDTLTLPLTG